MKFKDIIKNQTWFSIEITLLKLYPDQKNNIPEYEKVYNSLLLMKPEMQDISIELNLQTDDFDGEEYTDVSGKYNNPKNKDEEFSQALEFTPWNKWLGMDISDDSLQNFTKPEILVHCLYEMTFVGFEEKEIQEKIKSIEKEVEEYKDMSEEEKKENTKSLDDFLKELDDNENEE